MESYDKSLTLLTAFNRGANAGVRAAQSKRLYRHLSSGATADAVLTIRADRKLITSRVTLINDSRVHEIPAYSVSPIFPGQPKRSSGLRGLPPYRLAVAHVRSRTETMVVYGYVMKIDLVFPGCQHHRERKGQHEHRHL